MSHYRVVLDGEVAFRGENKFAMRDVYKQIRERNPDSRVLFQEYYVPPSPEGHWMDLGIFDNGVRHGD